MAKKPNIPNGYVMIARSILESEVWAWAPWRLKLWLWMLLKANHNPTRKLARGQFWTTTEDLREAAKYYVGKRPVRPSKSQIMKFSRRLREGTMIATKKATRGMVVTVLQYEHYQDPSNYEGAYEGLTKAPRRSVEGSRIDKNGRTRRKKKEETTTEKVLWTGSEFIIPPAVLEQWEAAYPDIPVGDEILRATQWRIDHPEKQYKSDRGFLGGWLGRQSRKAKEVVEEMPPGHTAPRYPTPEEADYLTGRTERMEAP